MRALLLLRLFGDYPTAGFFILVLLLTALAMAIAYAFDFILGRFPQGHVSSRTQSIRPFAPQHKGPVPSIGGGEAGLNFTDEPTSVQCLDARSFGEHRQDAKD
jgi:hypothetical protein